CDGVSRHPGKPRAMLTVTAAQLPPLLEWLADRIVDGAPIPSSGWREEAWRKNPHTKNLAVPDTGFLTVDLLMPEPYRPQFVIRIVGDSVNLIPTKRKDR